MSDATATAKALGIEFDDADLGMTPEELSELMTTADTLGSLEDDEAALMASLSEYGINDDAPTTDDATPPTAFSIGTESNNTPPTESNNTPPGPVPSPADMKPSPPATTIPAMAQAQPSSAEDTAVPARPPAEAPARPPPLRYSKDHKAASRQPNQMPERSDDLMDDLMRAFDFGKKAVKEAYYDVKQSVRDGFSVECSVHFSEKDNRLGMRVERRPIDDALEVTYVEPGGAAERVGVKLDDVVIMVDRRTGGGGYDALLKLLTRGTRPMELQLLRPQHVLNSPLHFKLEDELSKAVRILNSLTKAPEMREDAGQDVMRYLLTNAVGFLFMTTVKIGGLVSGMGGTGILVARLPDGSWSAPVAVASFGLSWGVQIGAALSDVMVIFTKPAAMNALRSEDGTELSLGPESGIAVGPVGRTVSVSHGLSHLGVSDGRGPTFSGQFPSFETRPLQLQSSSEEVAARAKAMRVQAAAQAAEASKHLKPAYSYSHSKGLFVGVSLEGSVLTVRHDINSDFYGHRINVGAALEGGLPRPEKLRDAQELYSALKTLTGEKAPPAMTEPLSPPAPRAPSRGQSQGLHNKSQGRWNSPRDTPAANPFSELPKASSRSADLPQAQAVVSSTPLPTTTPSYGIGEESDGEVEEFSV